MGAHRSSSNIHGLTSGQDQSPNPRAWDCIRRYTVDDAPSVGPDVHAAPDLPVARHGPRSIREIAHLVLGVADENPAGAHVVGPKYPRRVFYCAVEKDR